MYPLTTILGTLFNVLNLQSYRVQIWITYLGMNAFFNGCCDSFCMTCIYGNEYTELYDVRYDIVSADDITS